MAAIPAQHGMVRDDSLMLSGTLYGQAYMPSLYANAYIDFLYGIAYKYSNEEPNHAAHRP